MMLSMLSFKLTSTSSTLPRLTVISWSKSLFDANLPFIPQTNNLEQKETLPVLKTRCFQPPLHHLRLFPDFLVPCRKTKTYVSFSSLISDHLTNENSSLAKVRIYLICLHLASSTFEPSSIVSTRFACSLWTWLFIIFMMTMMFY